MNIDRWCLVEYGSPINIIEPIAERMRLEGSVVRDLLLHTGIRIGEALGFTYNPISVLGNNVRIENIAGLIRVAPGIELEVVPKFLGADSINVRWREDFFFIATLSKHGRLLNTERLKARLGERGDLHTLIARSMIDMYWSNHRRPLRTYNTRRFVDFAFDGDVEPESIIYPDPDGFDQSAIIYDRQNSYNAVILAAVRELLPNLRDPSDIAQMERVIQALLPQSASIGAIRNRRFPSRAKRWQPLYDLSVDILKGFGLTLSSGSLRSPGYIIETWRVWQDLVGVALRLGLGSHRVQSQVSTTLGIRQRMKSDHGGVPSKVRVKPDYIILDVNSTETSFIIDAKYKGNVKNGQVSIVESDLYEALAFSHATRCNTIILAYPAPPSEKLEIGQVIPFEIIEVGFVCVIGVKIETKGISSTGGLMNFASRCSSDFQMIAERRENCINTILL